MDRDELDGMLYEESQEVVYEEIESHTEVNPLNEHLQDLLEEGWVRFDEEGNVISQL